MATTDINSMGKLNADQGICGFTSSLYALYTHSPRKTELSEGAEVETRMLAEIKTYLKLLQADNRVDLLSAIQSFTRSFGGAYTNFDLDKYIERINATVSVNGGALGDFSIAMPPEAVVDYLRRACDFKSAKLLTGNMPDPAELILGLCSTQMREYKGLAHYVYQLNGTVYSWGKQFGSVQQAAAAAHESWSVGHKIAIT